MASIVYVTRDIERALGRIPVGEYYVVTNKTPYSIHIQQLYPDNIYLIDSVEILDTHELLTHPEVSKIIYTKKASIVVFKNTTQIEGICKKNAWHLLNPSAELAEKIENKITQVAWLGELENLLPPHQILITKDIVWSKKSFILQWSHSHSGDGTLLITKEEELKNIQEKFPLREARVTDFIKGPMFTVNIVVTNTVNLLGNISYQITGILPFTENIFSTIGNDWSLPHSLLSESQLEEFNAIAEKVALKMQQSGWKGLFGIDVIWDEEKNMLHLIEINARQPASTTYESELQRAFNLAGQTTFDAHLDALMGNPVLPLIPINDGAQILQRVTSQFKKVDAEKLKVKGYNVIEYNNEKLNSDLARIQSVQGIMETHNKFNSRGKTISEVLLEI